MATCGVLRLAAFYSLAEVRPRHTVTISRCLLSVLLTRFGYFPRPQHCDPLAVFATIAVADCLRVRLLAATVSDTSGTALGPCARKFDRYQCVALVIVAGGTLSWELLVKRGPESHSQKSSK